MIAPAQCDARGRESSIAADVPLDLMCVVRVSAHRVRSHALRNFAGFVPAAEMTGSGQQMSV